MNKNNLINEKEIKDILTQIKNISISEIESNKKHEILADLWTTYYKGCYILNRQTLDSVDLFFATSNSSYIIDEEPLFKEVDTNELISAIEHLEEVMENNTYGLIDGISEREAKVILNWTVYNTRNNLIINNINIERASLTGLCGYCQSSSLFPLEDLRLKTTVNNTVEILNCKYRHAFGTVTIPIVGETLEEKQYLIDCSYRQFFSTTQCNDGRYYTVAEDFKGEIAPSAGYFMTQTEEENNMARALLKNGFVELTSENAKSYCNGFALSSIGLNSSEYEIKKVKNTTGSDYINSINNNVQEHDYDREDFINFGCNIFLPNKNNIIK